MDAEEIEEVEENAAAMSYHGGKGGLSVSGDGADLPDRPEEVPNRALIQLSVHVSGPILCLCL